jgi:four helix bundle protein
MGEATETQVWLDFSLDCGYMSKQNYDHLTAGYEEVGRMLSGMIANPSRFEPPGKR